MFEPLGDSKQLLFCPQASCISDDASNESPADSEHAGRVAPGSSATVRRAFGGEIRRRFIGKRLRSHLISAAAKQKNNKDKAKVP